MHKKIFQFEVILTLEKEGGYTAEVTKLPGCLSQGDTLEEAEKNIEEAIELYLETLEERGIPLPMRNNSKTLKMTIS